MGLVRFLLASSVVMFHSHSPGSAFLVRGFDAVPLFYVISGFYMSMILNGKYNCYYTFVTNRFLKIYPIYLLVLLVGAIASFSIYKGVLQDSWTIAEKFFLIISNVIIFGTEFFSVLTKAPGGVRFIGLHEPQDMGFGHLVIIGPAWSLSVELIFYLAAPFILKTTKKSLYLLLAFALLGLGYTIFIHSANVPQIPWNYNLFPASIIYFSLGAFSFKFYTKHTKSFIASGSFFGRAVQFSLFLIMVSTLIFYQKFGDFIVSSPFVFSIILLFFAIGPCFELTKQNKIDRFLGDISYPLYICHYLFTHHIQLSIHPFVPSLITAIMLLTLIQWPIDKFRERRIIKTAQASP